MIVTKWMSSGPDLSFPNLIYSSLSILVRTNWTVQILQCVLDSEEIPEQIWKSYLLLLPCVPLSCVLVQISIECRWALRVQWTQHLDPYRAIESRTACHPLCFSGYKYPCFTFIHLFTPHPLSFPSNSPWTLEPPLDFIDDEGDYAWLPHIVCRCVRTSSAIVTVVVLHHRVKAQRTYLHFFIFPKSQFFQFIAVVIFVDFYYSIWSIQ